MTNACRASVYIYTDTIMTFTELSLAEPILKALGEAGYHTPTEIQQNTIPQILAGHDILGTAQTGTGKTAAFSLPLLHLLSTKRAPNRTSIRALILTPTRELAQQVNASIQTYGKHLNIRSAVAVGGTNISFQIKDLRKNPEILVATPGRLFDLMDRKCVRLSDVELLVLDEADRMLDMGFIDEMRTVVRLTPATRQTLFFSATMSPAITKLAGEMLKDPVRIAVKNESSVPIAIEQKLFYVKGSDKMSLLGNLLGKLEVDKAIIFTRTKRQADKVAMQLDRKGVKASAIHSDRSQRQREAILANFKRGKLNILIATDIVARGIDVNGITHVINYEMPNDPENYVHRIGRTARAGTSGTALSFCDSEEVGMLKNIEKITKNVMDVDDQHKFHAADIASLKERISAPKPNERRYGKPKRFTSRRQENGSRGGKKFSSSSRRRPSSNRSAA